MKTEAGIHPFEAAGLGKAPFRYAGMVDQDIRYGNAVVKINGVECETKPGGTCDYCGTYIVHMFRVTSSDGRTFKVGSDCIEKVDAKLIVPVKADIKQFKAKQDRERIEAARSMLERPDVVEILKAFPHPQPKAAYNGATFHDYAVWIMRNAGITGKLGVARAIEKKTKAYADREV